MEYVLHLPRLRPYQKQLVLCPARQVVIVSARQVGKTVACASWLLGRACLRNGSRNGWAAPTYRQAEIGYETLKQLARSGGVLRDAVDHKLRLKLINHATIEFRSWERDENLLGSSYDHLVVDEAGLLTPRARAILISCLSATLGPVRYIGNPGPTGCEFWKLCQDALDGEKDDPRLWRFFKWTWRDLAGVLDGERRAEYERSIGQQKHELLPSEFNRLYEAEWASPEEAVFDAELLGKLFVIEPSDAPHPGHDYVIGVDVGLTVDYTVAAPLCTKCFQLHHLLRFRRGSSADFKNALAALAERFNHATLVIETNGPGQVLLDELVRIYKRVQRWVTTNDTKRDAIFEIVRRGRNDGLKLAPIAPLPQEMRVYQSRRNPMTGLWSFGAPEGAHDDCVMALAIAVGAATSGGAAYLQMLKDRAAAGKT